MKRKTRYTITLSALCLLFLASALAQGAYTIEPKTKGWAVHDPVDDSYVLTIQHEGHTINPIVVRIEPIVRDPNQEYFFDQLPLELRDYITINPDEMTIDSGESGDFKISIHFPDVPEIYNKTYEVRFLVIDSNPYNERYGKQEQLHIVRMFMPDGRPPPPEQPTPLYVYISAVIVFFIFMAAFVYLLRKKTMTIASQDSPFHAENEWKSLSKEGKTTPPDFSDGLNLENELSSVLTGTDDEIPVVDNVEKAKTTTPIKTTYKKQTRIKPVRNSE
jgi:hypothetical protein